MSRTKLKSNQQGLLLMLPYSHCESIFYNKMYIPILKSFYVCHALIITPFLLFWIDEAFNLIDFSFCNTSSLEIEQQSGTKLQCSYNE